MSIDFNSFEEMESYFNDSLSQEERRLFEAKLQIDSDLWEDYEQYKKMRKGFKDAARSDFMEKLILQDKELDTNKQPIYKYRAYAIAASLVFLIGLSITYYFNTKSLTKYEPEEIGLPTLMAGNNKQSSLQQANILFKKQKFKEASVIYSSLNSDTSIYYTGVTTYKVKDFKTAILCFEKTLTYNSSIYKNKAEYWLALAFIRLDDKQRAKVILIKVKDNPHHEYQNLAEKLYAKLFGAS